MTEEKIMQLMVDYDAAYHLATSDPSVDISVVRPFVTDEQLESDRAGIDRLRARGLALVGNARYQNLLVVSTGPSGPEQVIVCEDISAVRVLDSTGADVTPASRPDISPMRIDLVIAKSGAVVSRYETWDGDNSCGVE